MSDAAQTIIDQAEAFDDWAMSQSGLSVEVLDQAIAVFDRRWDWIDTHRQIYADNFGYFDSHAMRILATVNRLRGELARRAEGLGGEMSRGEVLALVGETAEHVKASRDAAIASGRIDPYRVRQKGLQSVWGWAYSVRVW